MTEDQLQEVEDQASAWGIAIELAVLTVMVRRFGRVKKPFSFLQARRWEQADMAEVERILSSAREHVFDWSDKKLESLEGHLTESAKPYYAASGATQGDLSDYIKAGKRSARQTIGDLVKTSVLRIVAPDGAKKPIANVYRTICDTAIINVVNGEPNYAYLSQAVQALSRGGVSVEYESGAHRELYSALSTNVMDGYRNTMSEVREKQAAEFGADGYEVSHHSLCAPDHLPYQGRQYSFAEMDAIQGGLKRPIGKGYNCRHMLTKVILGVSSQTPKSEILAAKERSTREVSWRSISGREQHGTAYDFSQAQRQMEQSIRKARAQAQLLDAAGDNDGAKAMRSRARELVRHYNAQCKAAKIDARPDRYRIYDLQKS